MQNGWSHFAIGIEKGKLNIYITLLSFQLDPIYGSIITNAGEDNHTRHCRGDHN